MQPKYIDTWYLLFCRFEYREQFIDEVLVLNSFGTIEDVCFESMYFYELCKAALIMNKRDKYKEYFANVNSREDRQRLQLLEGSM